ncbi:MAG: peptidoglycan-binding protein [Proteobacteria bacterium SG_bin9]|nr:MAG: peptidoglycan-binding protein [Proteobacteria bacterium SG_bin9]
MRDQNVGRKGFDRVLMAVAASFLTVAATSAQAQSSRGAADLAIDAAVPMPDAANLPPPSAADVKSTATVTPAATPTTTATAPSPAPEAAKPATTAAADPAADKLRDLLASKGARYFDRKGERVAVDAFYKSRDYAPVWSTNGAATARAKSAIARLKDADKDGLSSGDYPTPDFAASMSPDALAEADLKLTASILDYARHAQMGRMHFSRVAADIQYPDHTPEPSDILATVTTANDAAAALDGYNPPHKLYKQLRAELAKLRGETDAPLAKIDTGPVLKFTAAKKTKKQTVDAIAPEDARVPALRARLHVAGDASDQKYDQAVADAVRKFQASADIKATGQLDDATVRALNAPKRDRQIDIVRVNMERLRWLPRELGAKSLGDAYVILNIPDFTLKVMQKGEQVWTTRVVTGKPGNQATPLLTETMKFITVNPTWNVPPSIVYNEYLPALQQDPNVLTRMGLRLERRADGGIHISQPPGAGNALGRIRFNFPNKFLVYQHDTPDKHLFARDERAFSHGCMRVQNPDQYAAVLLGITLPNEKYTAERVRSMYGNSEIDIKFPTPIPVNITYQTAFVDDGGTLQFRKDVYGRDARMIALLKGSEGKDLESVVAHAQPNYSRPRAEIPQGVAFNGSNYSSGPSFFERLFGAPQPPPAPPARNQRRTAVR